MRVAITYAAAVSGFVAAVTAAGVQPGPSQSSTVPGLTVPAGFNVELVAGPPLVNRPIVADFDELGRLYVADSSGSNDKVEQQLAERPHRIVRLEDTNGDGRFDKSVVFADKMMFPEGTMWFDGSLYVAAPPSIWKLTDTNGDGTADQREEWFQGKTLTGCANDLHGPYLGPDGWIYWTKGAFAQQTYDRPGRAPFTTRASHIFRRRPGDTAIEPVMTGGMDNPVDVAFTPSGERLLTATFLEHPQLGRRDAIIHAVYGGVYGKPHAVLDGHKRTGDLMPVMAQLGPAVPSGLTRYASAVFGGDYRDNFFATMFNLHKVVRGVLEPNGSTFELRASDFLVSTSRDFHPTDVLEDADGSLLVVDTGPWYKLCCPTSQLAKPDVPGAIYRIRRSGAPRVDDPRGQRVDWGTLQPEALAKYLDDSRPAVQHRVLQQFAKAGSRAVAPLTAVLTSGASVEARRNAVWALTRIEGLDARGSVRTALADKDATVRHAAMHSAGLWRDREAVPALLESLKAGTPALKRAAAEAIGRTGDARAIQGLIDASAAQIDRTLEHSITYALIEIGDAAATLTYGNQRPSSRARRTALIAADQIEGGLQSAAVVPLLDSPDALLKETAWWIASHHPDWGDAVAGSLRARLEKAAGDRAELQGQLAQFGDTPAIQALLAATVVSPPSAAAQQTAFGAMTASKARVKVLPEAWVDPLLGALQSGDAETVRRSLSVIRAIPASKGSTGRVVEALSRVGRGAAHPVDIRLDALAAIPEGLTVVDPDVFSLLRASLDPGRPAMERTTAAAVIEKSKLDGAQLIALAPSLERAGPMELPRMLRAYENGTDEGVGQAMMAALEKSAGRAAIRPEQFRAGLAGYPQAVRTRGDALITALRADTAQQAERLDKLLATLGGGDIRKGQQVFNSPRVACTSCHAIGYLGGKIGPDLTRIGQVRSERDLLESIIFPNISFVRSYEPFTVTTRSGVVHAGVLRSDAGDEVVLGTAAGDEVRIPRSDVADMQPGTVSLMPAGLDQQLTREELADLLAFLKATRSGA